MRRALALLVRLVASAGSARTTPRSTCLAGSGDEAARCLDAYLGGDSADPAFAESAVRDNCSEDTVYALGGLGVDDLVTVLRNACVDFGKDLLASTTPSAGDAACRDALANGLAAVCERTVTLFGPHCAVH